MQGLRCCCRPRVTHMMQMSGKFWPIYKVLCPDGPGCPSLSPWPNELECHTCFSDGVVCHPSIGRFVKFLPKKCASLNTDWSLCSVSFPLLFPLCPPCRTSLVIVTDTEFSKSPVEALDLVEMLSLAYVDPSSLKRSLGGLQCMHPFLPFSPLFSPWFSMVTVVYVS